MAGVHRGENLRLGIAAVAGQAAAVTTIFDLLLFIIRVSLARHMDKLKSEIQLVEVYRTFNIADGDLRKALLEAAGIDVMIKDDIAAQNIDGWSLAAGGVKLLVRSEDEKRAREVLESPSPLPP